MSPIVAVNGNPTPINYCFNATATEQWQDNVVYETNLHKNVRYSNICLDVILFFYECIWLFKNLFTK